MNHTRTAIQTADLIAKKQISPVEVTAEYLQIIENTKTKLNSFITLCADQAIDFAEKQEKLIIHESTYIEKHPLAGIPLGIKDVYETKGIKTTFGCKHFEQNIPQKSAFVVEKMLNAGAAFLGKLNTHNLEYGPTGQNEHYGDMHNPWDISRYTGGSSGGSGAALASGQCLLATGSDSGGSIRIPASLCGITGLKTTFGLLSRSGLMQLSQSMDHHGPMTRTVADSALMLNYMVGHDVSDKQMTVTKEIDYLSSLSGELKGKKIGVPKEIMDSNMSNDVRLGIENIFTKLENEGAKIIEVSWPMIKYSYDISTAILMSDAAESLRWLVKEDPESVDYSVRQRIETGYFVPVYSYLQAQRLRTQLIQEGLTLLGDLDVFIGPTTPVTAPIIGEEWINLKGETRHVFEVLTYFTRLHNLTGFPALSIPCGLDSNNLPIGLQIAGKPFDEVTIFNIAYGIEKLINFEQIRMKNLPVN